MTEVLQTAVSLARVTRSPELGDTALGISAFDAVAELMVWDEGFAVLRRVRRPQAPSLSRLKLPRPGITAPMAREPWSSGSGRATAIFCACSTGMKTLRAFWKNMPRSFRMGARAAGGG